MAQEQKQELDMPMLSGLCRQHLHVAVYMQSLAQSSAPLPHPCILNGCASDTLPKVQGSRQPQECCSYHLMTDSGHVELFEGDAVITRMIQLAVCSTVLYM